MVVEIVVDSDWLVGYLRFTQMGARLSPMPTRGLIVRHARFGNVSDPADARPRLQVGQQSAWRQSVRAPEKARRADEETHWEHEVAVASACAAGDWSTGRWVLLWQRFGNACLMALQWDWARTFTTVSIPDGRFRPEPLADHLGGFLCAHGQQTKVMRLTTDEFLRRFLLHVLPKGFVRIRHYGLLASVNVSTKLERCR